MKRVPLVGNVEVLKATHNVGEQVAFQNCVNAGLWSGFVQGKREKFPREIALFVFSRCGFLILKKFELLRRWRDFGAIVSAENFDFGKLPICQRDCANKSSVGDEFFYSFFVCRQVFHTRTMSRIYGKLESAESVFYQIGSETICVFHVRFCFDGQIEKHEQPHDSIGAKSLHKSGFPAARVCDFLRKMFL